jgi:formylmethanofuran dehydrogenase subunit E
MEKFTDVESPDLRIIRFERCANCNEQCFTRDYLVRGEVRSLCEQCANDILGIRPVGE